MGTWKDVGVVLVLVVLQDLERSGLPLRSPTRHLSHSESVKTATDGGFIIAQREVMAVFDVANTLS